MCRLNTVILNQVDLEGSEPHVLEGAQLRSWELCDSGLASQTLVCLVFKMGMTVPASQDVGTAGWDHHACKAAGLARELGLGINRHQTNKEACFVGKQTPQSSFLEAGCVYHPHAQSPASGRPKAPVRAGGTKNYSGNLWVSNRHKTVNGRAAAATVTMGR